VVNAADLCMLSQLRVFCAIAGEFMVSLQWKVEDSGNVVEWTDEWISNQELTGLYCDSVTEFRDNEVQFGSLMVPEKNGLRVFLQPNKEANWIRAGDHTYGVWRIRWTSGSVRWLWRFETAKKALVLGPGCKFGSTYCYHWPKLGHLQSITR